MHDEDQSPAGWDRRRGQRRLADRLATPPLPSEPDLAALERLAKAATPGPWSHSVWHVYTGAGMSKRDVAQTGPAADAAYIAAVSPDVLLNLIAALRAANHRPDVPEALREARSREWWPDGRMVNCGLPGDEGFVGDAETPTDAKEIADRHNTDLRELVLRAANPTPEPARDEMCIGDPSHQYHSHDDDPEPAALPGETLRMAVERVLAEFDWWASEPRPAIDGGTVRIHKFGEVQPSMERALSALRSTLDAARSSPAPAEGLDAAWDEAEAALPPGAHLTTIIEAWSAHGPEGRRIYHDGLLHGRSGFVAALRALAARLSPPVDRDAPREAGE